MTVADAAVQGRASSGRRAAPINAARLLGLELRRNALPLMVPLIAALFWYDSYRPSTGNAPLYGLRTYWNIGEGHAILDVGPFVAGVAAWMGSRDARRGLADLVGVTPRPRWTVQLVTWLATTIWAVATFMICVGVMFTAYAHQHVGGAPPWWYVADGVVAVVAFSAAGFAIGSYWPSRFAAPVAVFGGFLAMLFSHQAGTHSDTGWTLIMPTNPNGNFNGSAQNDAGVFYHWLPDVPIARMIFLAGIAVAAVAVIGIPRKAGNIMLRSTAAVATIVGIAAAGTAVDLAATAKQTAHGAAIHVLHDAASDLAIPYTPVCGRTADLPLCVNPAYQRWLPNLDAALTPIMTEVAGLPGAPTRATQVAAATPNDSNGPPQPFSFGDQPVQLHMALGLLNMPGPCAFCGERITPSAFEGQIRLVFANAFVGATDISITPAQQAVQAALLNGAGVPFDGQPALATTTANFRQTTPSTTTGPVFAAARRLAALPIAEQRAWLAAHLPALRSGHLTLRQLP